MRAMAVLSSLGVTAILVAIGFYLAEGFGEKMQRADHVVASETGGEQMDESGWNFKISRTTGAHEAKQLEVAEGASTPLDEARVAQLLKGVAEPKTAEKPVDFALAPQSKPRPRPGKVLSESFPPPAASSAPPPKSSPPGPLRVLRHAPEGEVALAARVELVFSQPMTALSSLEAVGQEPPVKITPRPAGSWRWIDPRTLVFMHEQRMPMATEYEVVVPDNWRSTLGQSLEKPFRFRFSTPPVKLAPTHLGNHQRLRPEALIPLLANQDVRAESLLPLIEFQIKDRRIPAVMPSRAEQEAFEKNFVQMSSKLILVKPASPLPLDSEFSLVIRAGAPSAEGPRLSSVEDRYAFATYPPLKFMGLVNHGGRDALRPGESFMLGFNNELDPAQFDPKWVSVSPKIEDMQVAVFGNFLQINGNTEAEQVYEFEVKAEIRDLFGQTLGKNRLAKVKVGSPYPQLSWGLTPLSILDPADLPQVELASIGYRKLKIQLFRAEAKDWFPYRRMKYRGHYSQKDQWKPVRNPIKTLEIEHKNANKFSLTALDLKPYLKDGGQFLIYAEGQEAGQRKPGRVGQELALSAWVQVTQLGALAIGDGEDLRIWTNRLEDGKTLVGAELSIYDEKSALSGKPLWRALSDEQGLASVALSKLSETGKFLQVTKGADRLYLPESEHGGFENSDWTVHSSTPYLTYLTLTDRGLYRPGEKVHLKGWIRRIDPKNPLPELPVMRKGLGKLLPLLPGKSLQMELQAYDEQGGELAKGTARIDEFGAFDWAFELPTAPHLGYARVEAKLVEPNQSSTQVSFQIEEFRRPEFETKLELDPSHHFLGEQLEIGLSATYLAGGPLPNAKVTWNASVEKVHFHPPNNEKFQFGEAGHWGHFPYHSNPITQRLEGMTDERGTDRLRLDLPAAADGQTRALTVIGEVEDANAQAFSDQTNCLLHPASYYGGLYSPASFINQGEPYTFEFLVVDLDGKMVPGKKLTVLVRRVHNRQEKGQWVEGYDSIQEFELTAGSEPRRFSFATPKPGRYEILATLRDERGRQQITRTSRWVSGPGVTPSDNQSREILVMADRDRYELGDTANLMIHSPFAPAEGIWTVQRYGITSSGRISFSENSKVLALPIGAELLGGATFQIRLAGREKDGEGALARFKAVSASGSCEIAVPPNRQELKLDIRPEQAEMEPGKLCKLEIDVKDHAGKPRANAQVCFWAVDDAVLALGGYELQDPMALFFPRSNGPRAESEARDFLVFRNGMDAFRKLAEEANQAATDQIAFATSPAPEMARKSMAMESAAPAMAGAMGIMADSASPGSGGPMQARHNFNPLAVFQPDLRTDADGRIRTSFKLPDNLTRYRLFAVAVDGADFFGKAESSLTARLPLMLRPSPPRFLNFGDRCELPFLLQNQTDAPLDVELVVRVQNAVLTAGAGRRVRVPAHDRVEVRFPLAAQEPGSIRIQAAAFASGGARDAAEFEFPVWTPATSEAFAAYGELDGEGPVSQPLNAPSAVFPQFGGLKISTSSTLLQNLTDAVLYLQNYPFECSEQISSRVLSVAALSEMMATFDPDYQAPQVRAAMERDLNRLAQLQNPDGGFGFWQRNTQSWPFLSIHVAHALARASLKDFQVPEHMLRNSKEYLRQIEQRIDALPAEIRPGPEQRQALVAYALYTRRLFGDLDPRAAEQQLEKRKLAETPFEVLGWLLPCLSPSSPNRPVILRHLENRATQTASTAQFSSSYGDGAYLILHSSRRDDAVLLEALIEVDPKNPLIAKLMRGLLANRVQGRWDNTQECAWVLLAMDRYFRAYESKTPNFTARCWIGEGLAQEVTFKGRQTDTHETLVPMAWLKSQKKTDLLLAKEGSGRLYYRLGLDYAPLDLNAKALARGFTVTRNYAAVDDKADVRRDEKGVWHIKRGARVRVELLMSVPERRYHVALVDPLPGGFEALNPELPSQAGALPPGNEGDSPWGFYRPWRWYEHQNLRDSRAEAFTSQLWAGQYRHSYYARATTPGEFIVPPSKAEEMYAPETFGRSNADRVVID